MDAEEWSTWRRAFMVPWRLMFQDGHLLQLCALWSNFDFLWGFAGVPLHTLAEYCHAGNVFGIFIPLMKHFLAHQSWRRAYPSWTLVAFLWTSGRLGWLAFKHMFRAVDYFWSWGTNFAKWVFADYLWVSGFASVWCHAVSGDSWVIGLGRDIETANRTFLIEEADAVGFIFVDNAGWLSDGCVDWLGLVLRARLLLLDMWRRICLQWIYPLVVRLLWRSRCLLSNWRVSCLMVAVGVLSTFWTGFLFLNLLIHLDDLNVDGLIANILFVVSFIGVLVFLAWLFCW